MVRKNLQQRGMITFYVRQEFIPVFEEFIELIKKDDKMKNLQTTNRPNQIISVALIQLMSDYNQIRKEELKEIEKNKNIKTKEVINTN